MANSTDYLCVTLKNTIKKKIWRFRKSVNILYAIQQSFLILLVRTVFFNLFQVAEPFKNY